MSNKAIVIKQYTKAMITKDHPYFKITLNPDEQSQLEYFKGEVNRLSKELKNLKESVNTIIKKGDYIKNLETFRRMFLIEHCIIGFKGNHNIRRITIIQCKENIKSNHCKLYLECKGRRKVLNNILNLNV